MKQWSVDSAQLAHLLGQMKKFGGIVAGDASWNLTPTSLGIEWAGMGLEVPAEGEASVFARVKCVNMDGLAKMDFDAPGITTLRVGDGKLSLDGFSVPCVETVKAVPQLLPMGARTMHVVLLPYLHSASEIDAAGLRQPLEELNERKAASVKQATESLAWLGVEQKHLAAWLQAHLQAVAAGHETVSLDPRRVVIDQKGQAELF
jgi:hypothetical protein